MNELSNCCKKPVTILNKNQENKIFHICTGCGKVCDLSTMTDNEEKLVSCPFCEINVVKDISWGKEIIIHPDTKCVLSNKHFYLDEWNTRRPAEKLVPIDWEEIFNLIKLSSASQIFLSNKDHNIDVAIEDMKQLSKNISARFGSVPVKVEWPEEQSLEGVAREFWDEFRVRNQTIRECKTAHAQAQRVDVGMLVKALELSLTYLRAQNEVEHMLDGFSGKKPQPSDEDLELCEQALAEAKRG